MSVKAVEMVRKIRDQNYKEMKDLSPEEQIRFLRQKSQKLKAWLEKSKPKKVVRGAKKK